MVTKCLSVLISSLLLAAACFHSGARLFAQSLPQTRPSEATSDAPVPTRETFPQFIEAARQKAIKYVQELPNFICVQITKRYIRSPQRLSRTGMMQAEQWVLEDEITEELTYNDQKESYRLLKLDRRTGAFMSSEARRGSTSTGEFASVLGLLFQPASQAWFQMEGVEKISGRKTVRTRYQVEQVNSARELNYFLEGNLMRSVKVAYRGRCWLEAATGQVVRLELETVDIPVHFPIARSSLTIDYGPVDIAGTRAWLPVRAETWLATSTSKDLPEHEKLRESHNVIVFRDYHRFGSDVKIQYPPFR